MASSPPQDSPPSPPPESSSSSSSPPPDSSSPPPPKDSSPPPSSSPPPPTDSTPPPSSSPPPPKASSSPPPPKDSQPSPPPQSSSSPPPPKDSGSSPSNPPPSPQPPSSTTPSPPSSNPTPTPSPPPPSSTLSPPSSSTNTTKAPPPPPHAITSSSSKTPSSTASSGGSSSISSEAAIIIGVTVGVGLLIALVMVLLCLVCSKKKKKRSSEYYMENGNKGRDYYNNTPNPYWQKSNKPDYMIPSPSGALDSRLPPPPGSAGMDNGGNWPSPSLVMPTSDGSSSFSGPGMTPLPPPNPVVALGFSKNTFTYDELAAATGGFSRANLLGQGGFGYVHKGVLPSGKEIAVKSLKSGSGQGEREFQAEVEIISRVHHRHLVSLVGYCIAGGQRMLVYEFVPNNNLEHHLHGKNTPSMDWPTRLKIAIGSAKGLAYLHEDCHPRIIHRDIKTANILIDNTFEAQVADFGLAKLSEDTSTHVSTRIMGTFGYLAPEYASSGKLTEKSDVFSFGVMLLELITGRRPVDLTGEYDDMEDSLVEWARPIMSRALDDGDFDELVDPRLGKNYDHHEMACMVTCAAASVRHSARRRPKMSQIVRALEGEVSLEYLNEGVKPGQSTVFSSTGRGGSASDYDASSYSADMKKFRKMALGSQDYTSSEYGATSEYGLNPSCSSTDSVDIQINKH